MTNVDDASCVFRANNLAGEQETIEFRVDMRLAISLSLVVAFGLFVQAESSRSHLLFVLSTCLILCIRSLINVLERFCVRADIETRRKK